MMNLKHETDAAAAQPGQFLGGELSRVLAIDQQRSAGRARQQADDVEQGAFSGTGGTDERRKLPSLEGKIYAVQYFRFRWCADAVGVVHALLYQPILMHGSPPPAPAARRAGPA